MQISEDRISHLAHKILDRLWGDDLADFPDEARALDTIKSSLAAHFAVYDEIDTFVRKKLASYSQTKVPGSREWEILYHKLFQEELAKRNR